MNFLVFVNFPRFRKFYVLSISGHHKTHIFALPTATTSVQNERNAKATLLPLFGGILWLLDRATTGENLPSILTYRGRDSKRIRHHGCSVL